MDTVITFDALRDLMTQRPFKPFRIVMSSGQTYEIRHPEMAMLTRSDILVGVGEAEENIPADFRICSLLHVTAVEPISTAAGPST